MLSEDDIISQYPLHYFIWKNQSTQLKNYLCSKDVDIERKDPRQRTPLMLAAALNHKECVRILLKHNALVNVIDHTGFNVLHEAITTTDPKLIRDVSHKKRLQNYLIYCDGLPNLLSKTCDSADFYIEMKWEFTSWVPLLTQLFPSDTYKIYKRGSKIRIDTTLVDFDTDWKRGNKSFIINCSEKFGVFMEIDHDKQYVRKSKGKMVTMDEITEEEITDRLRMPIKTTFINTQKVTFERANSGIIGFRKDCVKNFNGYECKVYWAQNVELVSKIRIEHLTPEDKNRYKEKNNTALNTLLGIHEQNIPNLFENNSLEDNWRRNPYKLSVVDYFNLSPDDQRDIGAPREMKIKKQYFKANIWMSDDFPLSFKEQILPIIDLLAACNPHFAKLRDFIKCKLPTGFPIRIEIPLFHVMNAKITFGNVFACDSAVEGVHLTVPTIDQNQNSTNSDITMRPQDLRLRKCIIDDRCFNPPDNYTVDIILDENDDDLDKLLTMNEESKFFWEDAEGTENDSAAVKRYNEQEIATSLGTEQLSIMEALSYDSEKDLQRAIRLSWIEYNLKQQAQQSIYQAHSNGNISSSSSCPKPIVQTKCNNQTDSDYQIDQDEITSSSSYQSCDNSNDFHEYINVDIDKLQDSGEENEDERKIIRLTIEQSKRDHDEHIRGQQEEQEILERILKLSLIEK